MSKKALVDHIFKPNSDGVSEWITKEEVSSTPLELSKNENIRTTIISKQSFTTKIGTSVANIHETSTMNYSKMTVKELVVLCKRNGVKGYSKKKKTELVEMLSSAPKNEVTTDAKVDPPVKADRPVQTEDTGKIFEMAVSLGTGTPYEGSFKYSMELPEKLKPRLSKLRVIFPVTWSHTAKNGSRYDFTCVTDETKHLSAKSTKKGVGKVAPQVIGQCQPNKFCEIIGIEHTTIPALKQYIQSEIVKIIPILVGYTFDCPNIYYNHEKDTIRLITLDIPIEWNKYEFKWTCDWATWKNSSTLKIIYEQKEYALLEFQFHTKSRTNMAIRWCYENFLTIFKENLCIIDL